MPQVASDPKTYSLHSSLSQTARQAYTADRAAPSPFESLIDDTPEPAPEPRARTDANDRPSRNEPARGSQKTAKSNDKPKPDETEAPAEPSSTPDETQAASSDKPTAEAKGSEKPEGQSPEQAGDETKPAGDGKPADDVSPDLAAAQGPTQPALAPKADAIPATTVPVVTTETAPTAQADATETAIESAGAQKAQPDLLAALQAKSELKAKTGSDETPDTGGKKVANDKPAIDTKAAAKTPAPFDPDAPAQAASGETQDGVVSHEHAVKTANARRGAAPEDIVKKTSAEKSEGAAANGGNAAPKTADIVQPQVPTPPAHATAATATAAATAAAAPQPAAAAAAVPIEGVAVEIANKAVAGKNQFDIRLDPPELGRIHVRLEVDRDGNVISHMVADRTDTLDLLRRDTAGLERALQDAGLKTSDNSLQFSLRDQSANQQQNNDSAKTAQLVVEDDAATPAEAALRDYARYGARPGGLDIRV